MKQECCEEVGRAGESHDPSKRERGGEGNISMAFCIDENSVADYMGLG